MPFSDLRGKICSRNTLHYWLWRDWEWNRASLAQQETSSQWNAAKPTCPPAGQASRDFCFPGLCGPDGVHSAVLLMCTVRSLAHSAQTLTFAALPRLVPLSLGTADPACQLWDKVDDLARLLYPVCCVVLCLSLVCFLPLRSFFLSRAKKRIWNWILGKAEQQVPSYNSVHQLEISSVWLPKNKPLIQNMNACTFFFAKWKMQISPVEFEIAVPMYRAFLPRNMGFIEIVPFLFGTLWKRWYKTGKTTRLALSINTEIRDR